MGADRGREGRKSVFETVALSALIFYSPTGHCHHQKLRASLCLECASVGVGTRRLMTTSKPCWGYPSRVAAACGGGVRRGQCRDETLTPNYMYACILTRYDKQDCTHTQLG